MYAPNDNVRISFLKNIQKLETFNAKEFGLSPTSDQPETSRRDTATTRLPLPKDSPSLSTVLDQTSEAEHSEHDFGAQGTNAESTFPSDDIPLIEHQASSQSYVVPSPSHLRTQSPDPLLLLTQAESQTAHLVPFDSQQRGSMYAEDDVPLASPPQTQPRQLTEALSPRSPTRTPAARDLLPLLSNPVQDPAPEENDRQHTVSVDPEDDIPIAGPSRLKPAIPPTTHAPSPANPPSPPTSPLSSPHSPSSLPHHPPPLTPSPVPPASARHSRAPSDASLLEQLHAEGRRYALRERNVRQLKPYAYDRQVYTRQMRANPDAIVRFRSPGRRARRERDGYEDAQDGEGEGERERDRGAESSDAEVDPRELELELDPSDDERRRRRRRERSASGEAVRVERARQRSGVRGKINEDAGASTARRQRAMTPTGEAGVSGRVEQVARRSIADEWYQAKLRELDSSSEDDADGGNVAGPSRLTPQDAVHEETLKKRRKQRFPMRLPVRHKSPFVREQSQVSRSYQPKVYSNSVSAPASLPSSFSFSIPTRPHKLE
jgi:hypothetical protein